MSTNLLNSKGKRDAGMKKLLEYFQKKLID